MGRADLHNKILITVNYCAQRSGNQCKNSDVVRAFNYWFREDVSPETITRHLRQLAINGVLLRSHYEKNVYFSPVHPMSEIENPSHFFKMQEVCL